MFCPFCGGKIEDEGAFCASCGKRIDSSFKAGVSVANKDASVKTKKASPIITKEVASRLGWWLLLIALYSGVSMLFIFLPYIKDTIMIKTIYNSEIHGYLNFGDMLEVLVNGNKLFNPTVISTALGIGSYILVYSVPIFAFFGLIGTFISKKSTSLHIVSTIISVISALWVAVIIPLAVVLVPEFKQAIAASGGVIPEDADKFSFVILIVFAVVTVAFVIATVIVTSTINKRRVSNEKA